jgi:radical SAM enzyme (TIGR01210 family)
LQKRLGKAALHPRKPAGFFTELEPDGAGGVATIGAILLANKECPWKCVMCDLWKQTLDDSVSPGDIPAQIEYALERMPAVEWLKLYNAGSFFDSAAIPLEDYPAIASLAKPFKRIIVECHPRLATDRIPAFAGSLRGELEVAMGVETLHPGALEALNKRIAVADISQAFRFLGDARIRTRAFLLAHPPFIPASEKMEWAKRSIAGVAEMGAAVVSWIPARAGNGAMEQLKAMGEFSEPGIGELEHLLEWSLQLGSITCLADTWDLERFSSCPACFSARKARLQQMNLTQKAAPPVGCDCHKNETSW